VDQIIYYKRFNEISNKAINVPHFYSGGIWKPSIFRLYPNGVKGIKRKLDFISVWSLYYLLNKFDKDGLSVFLLYDQDKALHHSIVTKKSFKYPFMKEDDLQIGMIFTETEYRQKGLALCTINEILKRYKKPGRTIWYITKKDNIASRRLAEHFGFIEYTKAIRKRTFLFGVYHPVSENGKIMVELAESPEYSSITEVPGLRATKEQLARLYQRYHFTKEFAVDKDVLEIGCGAGLGLGYLANVAKKVVGGDVEEKNVTLAREYYKNRQKITADLMDAHNLPLPDESFDLVLLFETIYYLKDPKRCIAEAARLLRPNGNFVVCTVNKDWGDFHPSPYTYKYFSVPELYGLLKESFREVKLYGGFPIGNGGMGGEIISLIKRSAVKFKIIPGSLKARAYLKRIFVGRLVLLPPEITEGMTDYEPPIEIPPDRECKEFKILYAIGKK
jgi:SAM-dependent methyltransferase